MDSKTLEDELTTISPTVPEVPDLVPEMVPSEPTSSTAVPDIKETEQEFTTEIPEMEVKTMVPEVPDIMVPTDTTQKPIFDKVVDFITTTLKSVISEQESTQAPTSVEDMTTQIPELSDETDDMKTMAPELEKEITTMQMIIDSVSEITTMVPESVPEMVPTDTRDKMPRLDDEGKINIFQNLIMLVFLLSKSDEKRCIHC